MSMMTHIQTVAKKTIRAAALAIAMLLMTPIVGLVSASFNAPVHVQYSSNETVVYKTIHATVAYKG
jgi:hypothetical protein